MDYTQYSIEDLASDDTFIQWAKQNNRVSEEFWETFIAAHPRLKVKIFQARTLVLNLGKAENLQHSEEQIDAMWKGIENRFDQVTGTSGSEVKPGFRFSVAIAAMVSLLLISVVWYVSDGKNDQRSDSLAGQQTVGPLFIEKVNTSGNVLLVHLSDGTTVALENNSRLKYRKHYQGAALREVYLKGEAFFQVAKSPTQPFLVHSNEVVTRVLGTSFRVKAPDGQGEVTVSVKTGKVSVYTLGKGDAGEESQKNAVILLPNQQATYMRDHESFGKGLIAEPEIILPSLNEADFTFDDTPIAEVFEVLENAYGIDIIFDEEVMNNCFITAPLGSEPLFEKLKIICRAIGARYETIDAKVVVTSAGCLNL